MKRALVAGAGLLAVALAVLRSDAQRIDPRKPSVFVVGPAPGAAPMHRVDAQRSGFSKTPLPTGALRIAWRKTIAQTLDQPALVGEAGTLAVVSMRGDVTFLDEQGEERATVKVGAAQVGSAAVASDGTVVYMTTAGDAVGVRRSSPHPRFITRIGGKPNPAAAPLALDDGGVLLATTSVELNDLVLLDAEGNVRARAALPERPAHPLVSAGDKVLAVTTTGAVFGWVPGREPVRLGSFGAPVDGGAVLADGKLLGVIEGNQLAEVDLASGGHQMRAVAPQGLYLGPPAMRLGAATLLGLTATRGFVVTLDPSGQELVRAPIATIVPVPLADGGVPPLTAPFHTGPLVDARGTVAFSATDGHVGTVSVDGAVEMLGEILCMKSTRSGIVGLTPAGPGAFTVTCDGGLVVRVTGNDAKAASPPPPPSSSANPAKLRTRDF